jgi:hydroxymethylpyrimidine pyrophosphatase-like HAD family hydrolase
VLRPRATKGTALRELAESLGVPRERVAAVGDWKNDEEMIRFAGTGVAMPNADPAVIAAADVVLPWDSENDGVARWLLGLLA